MKAVNTKTINTQIQIMGKQKFQAHARWTHLLARLRQAIHVELKAYPAKKIEELVVWIVCLPDFLGVC